MKWVKDPMFDHWLSPLGTITFEGLEFWFYPVGTGKGSEPRGPYSSLDAAQHAAVAHERHVRGRS